ncbi:MAG: RNA pseudouridine synthase [Deltaproteobacteria bacterium]|nr:RNA pseudouridine synthase [Deltaproteobacteria bacterium]
MRILLETPEFYAIDKPAGVPTIPDRLGSASVHDQFEAELAQKLWIVHRLDREVTGVLLFARTAAAHRALSLAFERGQAHKTYHAWTGGPEPAARQFRWQDKLLRGKKRAYAHPAGKDAITLAEFAGPAPQPGLWQWQLQPLTGRNHQLRVHLASRGWPIAGDQLYGSPVPWRQGEIALRAVTLQLDAAVLGRAIAIEAGPIEIFS